MHIHIAIIFVFLAATICFGEPPKDMPLDVKKNDQDVFKPYEELAKQTFPNIKRNFVKGIYQKEQRLLHVQITLKDNHERIEIPFVKVIYCQGDYFKGVIANDLYKVDGYAKGDTLSFMQNDIKNWVITDIEGNEEGNYLGKAIDAFQYKNVGIVFEITFINHQFQLKYVDSFVGNNISVDGILPAEIIEQAKNKLLKIFTKRMYDGEFFEEKKPFYSYCVYDFVVKKFVEE